MVQLVHAVLAVVAPLSYDDSASKSTAKQRVR